MKFQISPRASDIIILIYVIGSLYLRFYFESKVQISPLNSIVIGLSFVVIIWSLVKLKVLNPNWFGLFSKSSNLKA
ncbi:MAG: hypothetical protein MK202_16855 [Tenacibaculum sp.]|nr:hypothetical protein [Tenacibaculum sp.]